MKEAWSWWRKWDVKIERQQLDDEGKDVSSLQERFDALLADDIEEDAVFQQAVGELFDEAAALPESPVMAAKEPSDLDTIHLVRPTHRTLPKLTFSQDELYNHLYGAWLGRCAGCLLGKPVEGWRTEKLWTLLTESGSEDITDYLWRMDLKPDVVEKHDAAKLLEFGQTIAHMPEDDDTNYTTLGLELIQRKGLGFTGEDVGWFWLNTLPYLHVCTAERVAYRNLINEIAPPQSATFRNPYREWIGAQIRGDFFGYIAPGRPELAAELAWRDASISHVKNGIYGEMWVAAMLAAAAVEDDMSRILEAGLGEIPKDCRLAQAIRKVMQWYHEGVAYPDAVARIHTQWNEHDPHHWCHTISNAQIVVIGLLYGEGDFERSVTRAVYPCFDTDCNGATVGSILGMILGAKRLPAKWIDILNDTLHTGVAGYHVVKISELARKTLQRIDNSSSWRK